MKGYVKEIVKGEVYELFYDAPRKENGARNQKHRRFRGSQRAADAELIRLVGLAKEKPKEPAAEVPTITVGEWLDRWLDEVAASRVRETTIGPYRSHLKAVKAGLGHILLAELTTRDIQLFSGGSQKSREARTVLHQLVILKQALQQAVDEGKLPKNPAAAVKPPRPAPKTRPALEPEQVQALLAAVKGTELWIPVTLGVGAGLRESEALGLLWPAVRLEQNLLWVEQVLYRAKGKGLALKEPKTRTSRRPVPLSKSVVLALRDHQRTSPASEFVICKEDGRPVRHDYLSKKFGKLMDAMGWPDITFHSLRRTHASLLAHAGVMPKVVQERLGHSDSSVTQEIYTTVLGGAARAAAEAYDTLLATE